MSNADPSLPPPPGPPPPGPGQPRPRPTTVTVSTWLLWVAAGLAVIGTLANLLTLGTVSDVYEQAYAGTELESTTDGTVIGIVVGAIISFLFAIGYVVLGIFNNRGKNASRIVTWVVGGLSLCCGGALLALTGLTAGMEVEGGPDPAEVDRMLSDALPGWYDPVYWITTVGGLAAVLVALILLALPASNEFFRKPAADELFEPPPNYPPPPGGNPPPPPGGNPPPAPGSPPGPPPAA